VDVASYQTFATRWGNPTCIFSCWVNWCKTRLGICTIPRVQLERTEKTFLFSEGRNKWFAVPTVKTFPCFFSNFQLTQVIQEKRITKTLSLIRKGSTSYSNRWTDTFLLLMNSKSSEKTSRTC